MFQILVASPRWFLYLTMHESNERNVMISTSTSIKSTNDTGDKEL